jgi:hypothetical protein
MRPSALADVPDAFIVVATPDYVNVASLLLYAGYRYLDDFAISMRRGHSFHAPEHRSLFPLEERYLSIARGGLVRSDMALADAGLDGGLSPTSLFRYGFAVFAVSWRRSVLAGWLGKHVAKLQRKIRALRQK